jgi:hypothetical protein
MAFPGRDAIHWDQAPVPSAPGHDMLGPICVRPAAVLAAFALLRSTDFTCSAGSGVFAPDSGIRITITGVVHFLEVEGGCWQLEGGDGTRYELRPDQAPRSVLVDGAQVVLVARRRTDLASTCMVGENIDVERVDSVKRP